MTDEQLLQYELPAVPFVVFGSRNEAYGDSVRQAVRDGLLAAPFGRTSVLGPNVFTELLKLTDAGRVRCGLPVDKVPQQQRGLFDV